MATFKAPEAVVKDQIKKNLKSIALAVSLGGKAGAYHEKKGHNTPEGMNELYGYSLPLVKKCITELKSAGELK